MRGLKIITFMLFLLLLTTILSGCEPVMYEGKDIDLYTVAAYNVIGVGDKSQENDDDRITMVESDSYGRKLFLYNSSGKSYLNGDRQIFALCICQKSTKDEAFYFEDDCAVICDESGMVDEETLSSFKNKNDWDKPLDESKMKSSPMMSRSAIKPEWKEQMYYFIKKRFRAYPEEPICADILCSDKYGRQLFVFRKEPLESSRTTVVIVLPDGSIDEDTGFCEMTDELLLDYTDFIKDFKSRNNWNEELD